MAITEPSQATSLEAVLQTIRPAVRAEHPYLVGGTDTPVKLNQNESPFDLPADLKAELLDAFARVDFNRYPTEQPDRLRHALADALACDPEGLLIGNGSNELTYTLGLVLIDPGTPVVLPRPMFSLYEKVVRLFDGALTPVPPRPDLRFDTEGLLAAVRAVRPALVVLTTPNNPTGLAMTPAEVEAVVAEAAPGFVVVDEAYVEFNEAGSVQPLLEAYPNLLVMRTFSKAYGLAGLRIGYLMGHPAVIREFGKSRLPFMVDRLAEMTACALLARPALIRERVAAMRAARQELEAMLAAMEGVEVVPSQTNFVLFRTPVEPALLMARLAEQGVLVRNMGGYPELKGYLRVNAGTPAENKAFRAALESALQKPVTAPDASPSS
ncbi:MAG: histidinol-phosphate transaminase [Bacteroidetes bacterium]|nr:MAG: histidinol-phosphate transaminase [Bacteroidota bacterium]